MKKRKKNDKSRGVNPRWKITAVISLLLFSMALSYIVYFQYKKQSSQNRLLSSRVYNNILQPGELLIYNYAPLEKRLRAIITDRNVDKIGVYIQNLRDGVSLGINQDMEFEPASLNKIPMSIVVLHMVEQGNLKIDSRFTVTREDYDAKSGTRQLQVGSSYTVRELLHDMLSDSGNTSFRVLRRVVDMNKFAYLTCYINYYSNSEKKENCKDGLPLTTTPIANSRIFWSLYLSSILRAEHSEYILTELLHSSYDIYTVAGIPREDRVAQKYAALYQNDEKYFHNCGILYNRRSRVFYCIMTRDIDQKAAEKIVGALLHELHSYFEDFNTRMSQ